MNLAKILTSLKESQLSFSRYRFTQKCLIVASLQRLTLYIRACMGVARGYVCVCTQAHTCPTLNLAWKGPKTSDREFFFEGRLKSRSVTTVGSIYRFYGLFAPTTLPWLRFLKQVSLSLSLSLSLIRVNIRWSVLKIRNKQFVNKC